MIAYVSLFISVLCLIILVVILINVKKIFSTQNIMKKVENLMNKRITEINRISYEDTQLVKESSKTIRTLIAKTDDEIKKYEEAAARLRNLLHQVENTKGYEDIANTEIVYKEPQRSDKNSAEIVSYKNLINKKTIKVQNSSDSKSDSTNFTSYAKNKKSDFSSNVKKMSETGYTVEEIADSLACSITEVQYILDLGL